MSKKKEGYSILMADINIEDHNNVKNAARECGVNHVFTSVYNGSQLMDYLVRKGAYTRESDGTPDLLIMDINLDLVSGFEILEFLSDHEKFSEMPIYILTKTVKEEEAVKAREYGVRDFFQKPLAYTEWIKMVGNICKDTFGKKHTKAAEY
jgi:DNA-binding response OmpR family regulator